MIRLPDPAYVLQILKVLPRYPLRAGKRLAKRLIGLSPRPSTLDTFCSRHFWHLARFRPIAKLTVTDYRNSEGAGSRALMTMFTIALCRAYGIRYVHTPFHGIAHTVGDQEKWDAAWEDLFNLGEGEERARVRSSEAFDYFLLSYLTLLGPTDWVRFLQPALSEERPHYYIDFPVAEDDPARTDHEKRFVQLLQGELAEFRARYRQNKAIGEDRPFTVCVHIRRGDVDAGRTDMWTDLSCYSRCLDIVTEVLARHVINHRILIFSEGERDDFRELDRFDPEWFLDVDALESMRRLTEADILVIAKSCYSYVAAMLSEGVVVFEPGYLPGFEGWIPRDQAGCLDPTAFEQQLLAATSRWRPGGAG